MATIDFKLVHPHPIYFHVSPPLPYRFSPSFPPASSIQNNHSPSKLPTSLEAYEHQQQPTIDTGPLFAMFKNTTKTIVKGIDNTQCYIHVFTKKLKTVIVTGETSVKNHLEQSETNLHQRITSIDNKFKGLAAEIRSMFTQSNHNLAELNGGLQHVFTSTDITLAGMSKHINAVSQNHQTINNRVHKIFQSLQVALDQLKKNQNSIINNHELSKKT
ncbi:hypothetical protein BDK51DRAFT_52293 [Blyttiomyces helicus]|uniref:Uncharacterized protein n=1 Tax=Blyttiomyces helicus TaxID=388810 RepID=A0A4P9WEH7_9FUNG|nr:hypothetical protein BDK51DRAFT_52293 [Blyttiomyces helicus]|eukprot:RKO88796.1 hypothetical protein BDK51DRAFT_52293 [Blyttiomyces helicus]